MSEPQPTRRGLLTRWLLPAPLRWSLIELCRRTTHEGWDRLPAATVGGAGLALITSAAEPWPIAARALAAWAGPLHLALPQSAGDQRLARLLCSENRESPRLATDLASIEAALAGGGKVLFVTKADAPPERPTLPIPDRTPILPIAVEQPARGRYRLVIGEPQPPRT